MPDRLVLRGTVGADLSDDETSELKQQARQAVEDLEEVEDWQVLYQQQQDVHQVGMVLRTSLDRLASRPGKGRYLGIVILDDDGELVSEKFITNPAIKQEKGRDGLALNVLSNNGIDEVVLAEEPDELLGSALTELGLKYAVPSSDDLETVKDSLPSLSFHSP